MERQAMRENRIEAIQQFIRRNVDRTVGEEEIASIKRMSDQTLHLLCAAIDAQ